MTLCAFCESHTTEVMDFGDVALAGAFLKPEDFRGEQKFRLSLDFCENCFLLQVRNGIPPETLFNDYFYFSSAIGSLRKHFARYAEEVVLRFNPQSVLEIGCNDGVFLKPMADLGVKRLIGVDPAKNVTATIQDQRIEIINDYFGPGVVEGEVDVVVANNVFAHIPNINGVTEAVADLIGSKGVFVFEVNRLDSMISDLQYDWVYHEHLFYYSAICLSKHFERFGMEIFDLQRIGTHAGSTRYYVAAKGTRTITKQVMSQIERDKWAKLDSIERFHRFAKEAATHRDELRALVAEAKKNGETVAGYGACGRTNTMLQFCGLRAEDIDFIVDDAPAKHGYYTPGSHIPIVPNSVLYEKNPDKLIVFAWSFMSEIVEKCVDYDGDIIIPLPHIYAKRKRNHP